MNQEPVRVAVTGAAGKLAYSLLFHLGSGAAFGVDRPVCLNLIEIPEAQEVLKGVVMELEDCAFPLLQEVVATSDLKEGFQKVQWVVLAGAKPPEEFKTQNDFIATNSKTFYEQAQSIQEQAAFDVKILAVANPCNTNCWAARQGAPDIPDNCWFGLSRLSETRAKHRLARKVGVEATDVTNLAVWGNCSSTIYSDFQNAKISGKFADEVIPEKKWLETKFLNSVAKRRSQIVEARKGPPAASAANAVIDVIHFLRDPDPPGDWFSMVIASDGSYGVDKGLFSSFPTHRRSSECCDWEIVPNIRLNEYSRAKIQASAKELKKERDVAKKAIGLK